jgi:hypothetical protein
MDDHRRGHQVDAHAAGLEAAHEYATGGILVKSFNDFFTVGGFSGQAYEINGRLGEIFFHNADHVQELAVNYHLLVRFLDFLQEVP